IHNLSESLEFVGIRVLPSPEFRGNEAAAYIARQGKEILTGCIAVAPFTSGERQRVALCQAAGQLFLKIDPALNIRQVLYRFAGAFLITDKALRAEVGGRRRILETEELLIVKRRYGISIAALLLRLRDLEIITPGYCKSCYIAANKRGWRAEEP